MTPSRNTLHSADAFTSVPFTGNPASVIVLPGNNPWPETGLLQKIAAEFNLSETAFIRKTQSTSPNDYDLRWFTPTKEVKLCGHATLASAHVLRSFPGLLTVPLTANIIFHTLSGELEVDIQSKDGLIKMDFPADSLVSIQVNVAAEKVAVALGLSISDLVNIEISESLRYVVIEVAQSVDIASLTVDSSALGAMFPEDCFVQAVTNLSATGTLLCRVFASNAGILEDPVTGSAYTVLGPYWERKTGLKSFQARQASKRGGDITVDVGDNGRVIVGGEVVSVMEGMLYY